MADVRDTIEKAMADADSANAQAQDAIANGQGEAVNEGTEPVPPRAQEIIRDMAAEALAEERASWQERIDASHDAMLRAVADLENHKRRAREESDLRVQSELGNLLEGFLPLADNLARAKEAAAGNQVIQDGIEMVEQAFFATLALHDIDPIIALGSEFDPALHEAIGTSAVPAGLVGGLVVEEYEKGYTWNGRLLRPSKVIVTKEKE